MIRTESEYLQALEKVKRNREVQEKLREQLISDGRTPEEINRGMAPLLSFHAQLADDVEWYENARRGSIKAINSFTEIGKLLIALRIRNGLSQRQLAERLQISESNVSRDERNEYHGVTAERAQRIIDALKASIVTEVQESYKEPERELAAIG